MTADTEKRTVEDILEYEWGGRLAIALTIGEIKVNCENFVASYTDSNKPGRSIMWDVVDNDGIPHEFLELCAKIAEFEVLL